MDSGNSGSIQSSSGGGGGGDEEYDSRGDTIPTTFMSNHPGKYYNPISNPPPLFNPPPPNYLDAFSQSQANNNPNHSLSNLDDLVWSRGLQLDHPYYTTLVGNLTPASSTQSSHGQGQGQGQGSYHNSSTTTMLRPVQEHGPGIMKNPKKRTRASRRAPTTVLTTDTSNFRAMVQEFTGIPAPPFSAASSSYSRRLDLFGTGAAAMGGSSFLYPLRPSAHKIHQTPSFLNSSSVETSTNTNNMQNDPMLTFQSLLQQQPAPSNFPPQINYSEGPTFGTKFQGSSQLEELRMNHGNQNVNYSHEKGLEMINNNVSSRGGEGTVDSWICPSD